MKRVVIFVAAASSLFGASFVGQRHLERRQTDRQTEHLETELQMWEARSEAPAPTVEERPRRSTTSTLAELESLAVTGAIGIDAIEGTPRSDDSGLIDYRISGVTEASKLTRLLVAIETGDELPTVVGLSVEAGDPMGTRFRLDLVGSGRETGGRER